MANQDYVVSMWNTSSIDANGEEGRWEFADEMISEFAIQFKSERQKILNIVREISEDGWIFTLKRINTERIAKEFENGVVITDVQSAYDGTHNTDKSFLQVQVMAPKCDVFQISIKEWKYLYIHRLGTKVYGNPNKENVMVLFGWNK